MFKKSGIVTKVSNYDNFSSIALVKTSVSTNCQDCSSKNVCRSIKSNDNEKKIEIEVQNDMKAKVGNRVILSIDTIALLKSAFLLYIFPILSMIFGMFICNFISDFLSFNFKKTFPIFGAFLFLILSFIIVRVIAKRLTKESSYQPKIIKILNNSAYINNARTTNKCKTT